MPRVVRYTWPADELTTPVLPGADMSRRQTADPKLRTIYGTIEIPVTPTAAYDDTVAWTAPIVAADPWRNRVAAEGDEWASSGLAVVEDESSRPVAMRQEERAAIVVPPWRLDA